MNAQLLSLIVSIAFPIITIALAFIGGHAAAKINRKNKIADVVMHCMVRYDTISRDKPTISSREEAIYYFRRYFGLKSDQFDYWLAGLVDAENILSWFYSILNAFESRKDVTYSVDGVQEQITFEEAWNTVRESYIGQDTTFVRVVESIKTIAYAPGEPKEKYYKLVDLFTEIEEHEKDFIRFTEVNFIFMRIRGGDMASFRKMEWRLKKKRSTDFTFRPTSLD